MIGGLTPDGIDGTSAWSVETNQISTLYGYAVGTAGDVNGDGYADLVVGAPTYDGGLTDEGRAYVYYGSASGLRPWAAWTAESNQAYAYFGYSVSTAGGHVRTRLNPRCSKSLRRIDDTVRFTSARL